MNNGKFFAGLALGALVGSALSCFAHSNRGRDAEIAAAHAERKAMDLGLKAVETGAEIADKVAAEADKVVGKAKDKWEK